MEASSSRGGPPTSTIPKASCNSGTTSASARTATTIRWIPASTPWHRCSPSSSASAWSGVDDVAAPLVSVAIPLYRSRPFVDRIARNIETLDYPSVEILISDRHMDDDAIELLGARFAGDPRIRLLRANDRAGWVEHY